MVSEAKKYRVDGEVGRFVFETHQVEQNGEVVVDTAALFPRLKGQQWYRTVGHKEIALVHGTITGSFRKTATWFNRVRHQPGATPYRTLSHTSEQEGEQVLNHLTQQADQILRAHQFEQNQPPEPNREHYQSQPLVALPPEIVTAAVQACAPDQSYEPEMLANPVSYEQSAASIQVSIDPVGVKQQKESRDGKPKANKRAMAYQTVAHIHQEQCSYTLNGRDVGSVLRLVLAFLLHNDLLKYNLICFVDGQRSLNKAVATIFAWFGPLQLILDWYHLEKKCKEQLSLAMHGREFRNQLLDQVRPLLWLGCVDRAMSELRAVDPAQIKNQDELDKLIDYLHRHQAAIPCYAVRQKLGLRNSSNRGEKSNDLLVSARQKHNGMSWSPTGSVALAALTALVRNHEYTQWFQARSIPFSFAT